MTKKSLSLPRTKYMALALWQTFFVEKCFLHCLFAQVITEQVGLDFNGELAQAKSGVSDL